MPSKQNKNTTFSKDNQTVEIRSKQEETNTKDVIPPVKPKETKKK